MQLGVGGGVGEWGGGWSGGVGVGSGGLGDVEWGESRVGDGVIIEGIGGGSNIHNIVT